LNKILQLLIPAQAFDFEASVPRAQQPAMPVVELLNLKTAKALGLTRRPSDRIAAAQLPGSTTTAQFTRLYLPLCARYSNAHNLSSAWIVELIC
jgi:hypothetical protein